MFFYVEVKKNSNIKMPNTDENNGQEAKINLKTAMRRFTFKKVTIKKGLPIRTTLRLFLYQFSLFFQNFFQYGVFIQLFGAEEPVVTFHSIILAFHTFFCYTA